ncbi:DsbA family oxidoreductase [Arenibacter aquaticus]|uniref:DsbA family oxidoreductase n=1 Tax=Arenibacter aquaticus TaxID=2489054 RepID=A0A3S0D8N2_9FLAO|nr:DsbA family oxidoreductase [Arenibacter aquaticus]RTE55547.1 DsbA family oxidoreductase [Arenibacter aquaticus]
MEIKIWSDIRCPFCYIGKRKFEEALKGFEHKDRVTISWKSFELDPNLKTQVNIKALEHFCSSKGIGEEQALEMFQHAAGMGKDVGLDLKFADVVVANSLNGHRLIKYAESKNKAPEMKEVLLQAHLTDGKNIDDVEVLANLGAEVGLDSKAVRSMLLSDDYTYEVRQDQLEARNLGINGVPFFVLDNTYGISGAQPTEVFLESLEKAWEKSTDTKEKTDVAEGDSCNVDGECR